MTYAAADIPVWVAVVIAFFLIFGAGLAVIGAIGVLRLPTFYQRIHAPTLSTSWGTGGVMTASILFFSIAGGRLVANAVTLEMEALLLARHADLGGALTRLSIERAEAIGSMTGWKPAR